MKKLKIRQLILVLLMLFILIPFTVNASENEITLKVDKTDLTIGDEVTLSASLPKDFETYAMLATLKYDNNVFQKIDESNFSISDTQMISFNENNNKFGIINKNGQISMGGGSFLTVKFKVKEDANVGDTNIALTNISSADGSKKVDFPTTSIKVFVSRDAKEGEIISPNKENVITEDNEDDIKVFSNLPIFIVCCVLFIILFLPFIYAFVQYLKNKKGKKLFYILFVVEVILTGIMLSLVLIQDHKKDVNQDGIKDYNDAKEIIDYLIDMKGTHKTDEEDTNTSDTSNDSSNHESNVTDESTSNNNGNTDNEKPSKNPSDWDVNGDGDVDVGDVGDIVDDVNKNTKVTLHEENQENEYYVNKGKITLKFSAEIEPKDVLITQVKIDNQLYDVTFINGMYVLKMETPEEPGKFDITITEVLVNNGETVKSKLKITREVLKEAPYINMFNLDDEKKSLSFNLVDKDDTFIEGTVNIYNQNDEVIKNGKVDKITELTDIPFESDQTYLIEIATDFDLDSNKKDNANHFDNEIMFSQEFMIGGDYNFSLTDTSITDAIQAGETPVVSFISTNNRNAEVVVANMNIKDKNKDYHITKKDGNYYEVELVGADTSIGEHSVTLNNVGLSSLKTFYNNSDYKANTLTYTVLKESPSIDELNLENNKDEKKVKATFQLKDENQALTKLTVMLVDSTGKIVTEQELTGEQLKKDSIDISLSYEKNYDGFYTVKILADYELSNQYKYTNKSLGEDSILVIDTNEIYITSITPDNNNLYPTKNKKDYGITFVVHVGESIKAVAPTKYNGRNYNQLQTITINGLNYSVDGVNGSTNTDYKVKANLIIPSEAGIFDIKASRVQLGISGYYNMTYTDIFSVEEKTLTVDVLKDKPKIENLIITDDYDKDEATFEFDVVLDSTEKKENFNDGTIELDDKKETIHEGHNKVTFHDIEKDTQFNVIFKSSYDLDSGILDAEGKYNQATNGELLTVIYGLYDENTYKNIAIENGKIISERNNEYFEKNEKIKLSFEITNIDEKLESIPEKVIINEKEYTLSKIDNNYEIILDGYHSSGIKELTITDIILNNGKKVTLTEPYIFSLEVLKDTPYMNDFTYEEVNDNIKVTLDLKDVDNTLIDNVKVIITDEKGNVVYNKDLEKEFTFMRDEETLRYYIKVLAHYDRDIDATLDSENHFQEFVLLDEVISLAEENIELKNITDINLYKTEEKNGIEKITLIDEISKNELDSALNSYFVEIVMTNMSTTRTKIKEVKEVDGHLILILNYKFVSRYDENTTQEIRINFGRIQENHKATNEMHPANAFKALLEDLKAGKDVELTRDYDASAYSDNTEFYVDSYSGNLNGNRHTIKNLTKPLFNSISDGKIENLKLEDITLASSSMQGALANKVTNEEIKDIFVYQLSQENVSSQSGTLVGNATNSTIESCRITKFSFPGGSITQQLGGLVGAATGSTIKNNYVVGTMSTGWNYRGGLIGMANNCTVENNYTKVTFGCGYGCDKLVNGILSTTSNNNTIFNNVSFSNSSNGMISNDSNSKGPNYYFNDNEVSNLPDGVIKVTSSDINSDFFKTTLGFDETVWDLKNTSIDDLPTLILENKTDLEEVEGYEIDKEQLYRNLMKLMPFYDNEKIVELARNVKESLLINDELIHIVPVDRNGSIVTYLTTDNSKKVSKIKLVFKSGEKSEYKVTYDKTYDMVATYKITDLNIDYSYNHYVINADSQVVNNLTNYLKDLDYTSNLDVLTINDDSRIYRDFYNETTKNELKDFVLKYLSNSNYTNTSNDNDINRYIEREVKQDKKIEKVLYVYNYFRRFYDLDIDGIKLYDFVMFNMQGFDESLTPEKITNLYIGNGTGTNFNTNITGNVYKSLLSDYTKLNRISNFLDYVVTHLSNHNMDEWISSQFKGILVEVPVKDHPEIQYTLWDHFSTEDDEYKGDRYAVYNYVLPILTLPKTAAYIISAPAQFTIGAQRVYMGNPENEVELTNFKNKMQTYVDRIASYYNTAYAILEDEKIFNDIHLYQVDKRTTKNENGVSVYNTPNSTNEPFHKNFDEVVNVWPASYGVNAGNWGDRIEWNVAGFMDTDLKTDGTVDDGHPTFMTWSHETAHYLDDRLFLRDYDRRFDSGGEDYADAFLMQEFSPLAIVMNLTVNYKDNYQVASNTTPERIDSQEKIQDFYSKMFETIYAIDYIEAQAFLKLTPEQKAEIGIQVSYPNEEKYSSPGSQYRSRLVSKFSQLTEEEWQEMPLNDINDLIENKIMIAPGIYKEGSRGDNLYGGEGINAVHWYQPNNPYGRPDSYSLKWLSYEMLGYAGYDNGFVEYASNINAISSTINNDIDDDSKGTQSIHNYKTDDMAIRKISKNQYSTIDEYKQGRFEQTKNKLAYLKYINVDEYAQKLYDALVKDSVEMQQQVNKLFQDYNGETNCLKDFWCTRYVQNARGYANTTKVRQEMYFELKDKTNDFREDIYSKDEKQEITFEIDTHGN